MMLTTAVLVLRFHVSEPGQPVAMAPARTWQLARPTVEPVQRLLVLAGALPAVVGLAQISARMSTTAGTVSHYRVRV